MPIFLLIFNLILCIWNSSTNATLMIAGTISFEGHKAALIVMDDRAIQPKQVGNKLPEDVEKDFEENVAKLNGAKKYAYLREHGRKMDGIQHKCLDLSEEGKFTSKGILCFADGRGIQKFVEGRILQKLAALDALGDSKEMAEQTRKILKELLENAPAEEKAVILHAQIEPNIGRTFYRLFVAKKSSGSRVGPMSRIQKKYAIGIGADTKMTEEWMTQIFGKAFSFEKEREWDRNGIRQKMRELKASLHDFDTLLGNFEAYVIQEITAESKAERVIRLKQTDNQ